MEKVNGRKSHSGAFVFYEQWAHAETRQDKRCGCFYCLRVFDPSEIEEWIEDERDTALCPYCGIDSVIGESSGYPLTREFLAEMQQYWF